MSTSTGCRTMAPLNATCQTCSPPEGLQPSEEEPSNVAHSTKRKQRRSVWNMASWNVRSLVDLEGSIETARQRSELVDAEDRRIDQVVRELERYRIKVAALQETKWFDNNMYSVGNSLVLTAGRSIPVTEHSVRRRGEGVAIVLSDQAVAAWRAGGSKWKPWSARMISVSIKVGPNISDCLHVFSCYAPTFAASREEKAKFYDDLQCALSQIPSREMCVVLGDFNARVGSRLDSDDEWQNVRGPHGYGETNEAGRDLLSFLSVNELAVCNTWFQKQSIHKATWQHPGTKQWHCIDFAVVRQSQRRKCLDVSVMRGAECNTDHQLLRIRVNIGCKRVYKKPCACGQSRKFDVLKLKGKAIDDKGELTARGRYLDMLSQMLEQKWKSEDTVEEKWEAVRLALSESAELTLGVEKKRSPDWFRESETDLSPLFENRNKLYKKWLSTGRESDKRKFKNARKEARQATRQAKNEWFKQKALTAQAGRHGGKVVWKCIRDMQRGRRGLVPLKTASVVDEDGNTCSTPQQMHERWRRHFTKILNIMSQFNEDQLKEARQRPVRSQMADLPTREELEDAIGKMKNGKAAGQSGILPEMIKAAICTDDFTDILLDLVQSVWKEGKVPKDWVDAVLIPIPKKGDLKNCDNWRGIALLDVIGKVIARLLQERLQELAEEVLPESQCGFRKGRSCADMIFVVRQLVEKSLEHKTKSFFTFIDLKKAYDSVPRRALWIALQKLGVPEVVVNLIRSFHTDMKAKIRLDGELLEEISVENGLRQGCCMAPVLFNLYTTLLIEHWREGLDGTDGVGVVVKHKYDKKLFRRYTRNAAEIKLTDCLFADDGALLASSREGAERAAVEYQNASANFGLTVSIQKTKHLVTGREVRESDKNPIVVDGGEIESVQQFQYLGSVISASGTVDVDIERRIAQASRAFGALRKAVFLDKNLKLSTKRKVYQACILSVLLYGSECWTLLKRHTRKLDVFHHRCIRIILGISNHEQWSKHITMREIRRKWGDDDTASTKVAQRRLQWLGHLARMPDSRVPKSVLFGWLCKPRPRCGPKKRWRDVIRQDLKVIEVEEDKWYDEAITSSRAKWRTLYRSGLEAHEDRQGMVTTDTPIERVECEDCHRSFRRESDKKRHKCTNERRKPVCEQRGAAQCSACGTWFRSRGGLSVHVCRTENQS